VEYTTSFTNNYWADQTKEEQISKACGINAADGKLTENISFEIQTQRVRNTLT
jgi:hypothetical protein